MNKLLTEFKDFAFKGNLIDMAVGIIIGGAFGTVMKSLVSDIFMPVLGLLTGKVNFSDKYIRLSSDIPEGTPLAKAAELGPVLTYGNFIEALISFLLVALAVFIVIIKVVGSLTKEDEPEEEEKDPEPTNEEKMLELLGQIRDKIS